MERMLRRIQEVLELPQDVVRASSDILRLLHLQEEQRPPASTYVDVLCGGRGPHGAVLSLVCK